MKVIIEKECREYFTVAEMDAAKQIVKEMKDDSFGIKNYAEMALICAFNNNTYGMQIYEASAKVARNKDVYDRFFDGSKSLDVWIEATAKLNIDSFVEIGFYLSDAWEITGRIGENADFRNKCYIQEYKRI